MKIFTLQDFYMKILCLIICGGIFIIIIFYLNKVKHKVVLKSLTGKITFKLDFSAEERKIYNCGEIEPIKIVFKIFTFQHHN